ncbi:uncharacterized protein METZ01_LOCUS470926, partial [marine metagenome]
YRQRLGQYFKRIDASTSNINGSSPYMAARASCLSRLDAMARTAVAASDGQRKTVMGPQQLQLVHKPLVISTRRSYYTPSRQTRSWASGLPPSCRRYSSPYFFLGFGFDLLLPALRAAAAAFLPAAVYA